MLANAGLSSFLWTYSNEDANPPTTSTVGLSVTPGASSAEGSWTQIATGGNIANDVYWIWIHVSAGSTNAASKPHLLDVGVDNAGGSSYTAVVSNIVCGAAAAQTAMGAGHYFFFPMYIKSGSSVAVRIQGGNATAGTVRIVAKFYGQPSNPELVPTACYSETIGTITNSDGVTFTPGTTADGTWTSLGTTTLNLWWWQLGYQVSNGTITVEGTYIDLAVGDGTNFHQIKRLYHIGGTSEFIGSLRHGNLMFTECYCPVKAGSTMYVRGRCSDAPDTGYNAVAVGFG